MPFSEDTSNVQDMIQELIGCAWGRTVKTPDDDQACTERAVQIVVIHDGSDEKEFKLCVVHRDRILKETTPHKDDRG